MTSERIPDFFVLGAPKCATTWLHSALEAHPSINMTAQKECNVLARVTDQNGVGVDYMHSSSDEAKEQVVPTNWETLYEAEFGPREPGHFLGDVSLSYVRPYVLEHIQRNFPNARAIYLVRDPIARLTSDRMQRIKTGRAVPSVDEAIGAYLRGDPEPNPIIESGLYAKKLELIFDYIPREQVLVLVMERILADEAASLGALRQIFEFLGVDADLDVQLPPRRNTASMPRSFFVARQFGRLKRSVLVRRLLNLRFVPVPLLRKLAGRIKEGNMRQVEPEDKHLTDAQRRRLVDIYAPDIARLEGLLGDRFPEWSTAVNAKPQPGRRAPERKSRPRQQLS